MVADLAVEKIGEGTAPVVVVIEMQACSRLFQANPEGSSAQDYQIVLPELVRFENYF
ncbi:MAG: hypothetical protein II047_12110 [Bacteroidales bacterium]|nr:hypothetical protein [Bacteroidales bacterium]